MHVSEKCVQEIYCERNVVGDCHKVRNMALKTRVVPRLVRLHLIHFSHRRTDGADQRSVPHLFNAVVIRGTIIHVSIGLLLLTLLCPLMIAQSFFDWEKNTL
jgi:hypothetical protein